MRKNKQKRKGFFAEFKEFISKGSVLDLAVGVIIGGAFTAIVTALTTHIFTPLINYVLSLIFKGDALEAARTPLGGWQYVVDEVTGLPTTQIDWDKSIYIDWGAFISAIINFFLVAFILFMIVRTINRAKEAKEKMAAAELERYYEKHPEERPAPKEEAAPAPTQEELLIQIRDILKEKK